MKGFISILFLFVSISVSAQLSDDFSDPNLSNRWTGTVSDFKVNEFEELQLDAAAGGTSFLSRQHTFSDSILWNFYLRMEFEPSASNRLRIWLISDNEQLDSGNGYYLEIGESGSQDAIRFFYKNGSSRTQLAVGEAGKVGLANADGRISMEYTSDREWIMKVDYDGGFLPAEEFRISHPVELNLPGNYFFGVWCTYTETRKNLFFFDDFRIEEPAPDTAAPVITQSSLEGNNSLRITFNEPVLESMATTAQNYNLNPTLALQSIQLITPTQVLLQYASSFQNQTTYSLTISGIEDLEGNQMNDSTLTFEYIEVIPVSKFDIIINEIMARPSPGRGLPEQEYLELYNVSAHAINLADLQIRDGSVVRFLPMITVLPGEYVILCNKNNAALFESFGKVAGMDNFPALTDAGKLLVLENRAAQYIHHVQYSDTWYRDDIKSRGGFSLELINPDAICQLSENWTGSDAGLGGTPGAANSVLERKPDMRQAKILSTYVEDSRNVLLSFDKLLDPATLSPGSFATFQPSLVINSIDITAPNLNVLRLNFAEDLNPGIVFEMSIQSTVLDCKSLPVTTSIKPSFGLPQAPVEGDIVINEVLYLPDVGGSRFVELINISDKIIDLSNLFLANAGGSTPEGFKISTLYQILPGSIVALTEQADYIKSRYEPPVSANIIYGRIPTLPDKSGNIQVYTTNQSAKVILDNLDYSDDFHFRLLSDKRGTSIERINPSGPTNDKSNWHSAASVVKNATPGYQNSQYRELNTDSDQFISIPDPFFSPDEDGNRDALQIIYELGGDGYRARVLIFDSEGRQVISLANGEILSASGSLKWDGSSESGSKSRIGIYIVLAELTSPDGTVIRYKKDVVLGGIFD